MTPVWPHGDPRTVARAILADHRYQTAPQGPAPKSLWDIILDWLGTWWDKLTRPLAHVTGNQAVTTVLGIIVLVVVLLFLVVVWVHFVHSWGGFKRRARAERRQGSPEGLDQTGDARALFDRAIAAAAAGRHREAAALLWASALRALDERGRVRYDAARTPGEWRRAVRDPAFDRLSRDAVVALFGDRGVDAALVTRMRSAYDALVSVP
jgi:hypothetical protein